MDLTWRTLAPAVILALLPPLLLPIDAQASFTLPGQLVSDGKDLLRSAPQGAAKTCTAPFRCKNARPTMLALAAIGTGALLDEPIRRSLQPRISPAQRRDAHRFASVFHPKHDMALAVGLYGLGLLSGFPSMRRTGLRGSEALLLNEAFTIVLKKATGRTRPSTSSDAFEFHPFGKPTSFPSGHTSSAFALATVLSRTAGRKAVTWASYGAATAVGFERVVENVHWSSDVIAGAILGTGVAWAVTEPQVDAAGFHLASRADPPGIALSWRF